MSVLKIKQLVGPSGTHRGAVVVCDTAGYPQWSSDINSVLQLPAGSNAQRPSSPTIGQVRYNTDNSQFEGYGPGSAWGSLGGVVSVDKKTQILPELTPGSTDNKLFFYTGDGTGNSVQQAEIGNSYLKIPSGTTANRDALTASNSMVRYNSSLNRYEVYNNKWSQLITTGQNWSTGNAGQFCRINTSGTDVEFVTFPTAVVKYQFRINYTASTKPSSVADIVDYPVSPQVPQNWSFTLLNNNNDIQVNHYMNQIPLFIMGGGWNIVNGGITLRSATATALQAVYDPNAGGSPNGMNTFKIIGITSGATNATAGYYAIIYVYFLST